jgi:hypothetical protein
VVTPIPRAGHFIAGVVLAGQYRAVSWEARSAEFICSAPADVATTCASGSVLIGVE